MQTFHYPQLSLRDKVRAPHTQQDFSSSNTDGLIQAANLTELTRVFNSTLPHRIMKLAVPTHTWSGASPSSAKNVISSNRAYIKKSMFFVIWDLWNHRSITSTQANVHQDPVKECVPCDLPQSRGHSCSKSSSDPWQPVQSVQYQLWKTRKKNKEKCVSST